MPPRHSFWTIILDGTATSFRAATQEELLPTLRQLRKKDPEASLKWFARGRLWASPTEAHAAGSRRRTRPRSRSRTEEPARDRDWRPGGKHEDPRARFAKGRKTRKAAARRPGTKAGPDRRKR